MLRSLAEGSRGRCWRPICCAMTAQRYTDRAAGVGRPGRRLFHPAPRASSERARRQHERAAGTIPHISSAGWTRAGCTPAQASCRGRSMATISTCCSARRSRAPAAGSGSSMATPSKRPFDHRRSMSMPLAETATFHPVIANCGLGTARNPDGLKRNREICLKGSVESRRKATSRISQALASCFWRSGSPHD